MKTIGVVVLLAIFSVGLFGVIEQHQRNQAMSVGGTRRTTEGLEPMSASNSRTV
jgi:hypothetical protein